MRILLCNNTLSIFAGSETATYSMAVELLRRGHEVTAFSFNLGELAKRMKEKGVEVVDTLDGRKDDFDLAICNHINPTNYIKSKCPNTPIIFTVHGIIGGPETPPLYADHFVAVSEEVRDLMKEKYNIKCDIIRNGVDLERFKEIKPRNKKIQNILISTSYYNKNSEAFKNIYDAISCINAMTHATGKDFSWLWEMDKTYNEVDLVITLGRGCIEAMACNRPVICLGHWGKNQQLSADGLVTAENIKAIRKNNFSSRHFRHEWNTKNIVKEFTKYDTETDYRNLVIKDHDIKKVVDKYLKIGKSIIDNNK